MQPDESPNKGKKVKSGDEAPDDKTVVVSAAEDAKTIQSLKGLSSFTIAEDKEPERPDKLLGTTLANKYEILGLLGKGGMSAVYKARNVATQKIVAVKVMHSHLLSDGNSLRRFQQEATAASRLSHPNAINVYDLGVTDDGQPYLIMDYLEGVSLSDELKAHGKLPPARAMHILVQAAAALAHAHQHGIVHRDFKPSNIMLIKSEGDSDFVKIVDFGIAKILPQEGGGEAAQLTGTGEIFGSPLYMSPEQCQGLTLDARSDVYSMGCVMYELLTGHVPFAGNNILETMYKQMTEAPEGFGDVGIDPRLVDRLQKIDFKAMEKNPAQRYQTMTDLRADLETAQALSGKGVKLGAVISIRAGEARRQLLNRLGTSKKLVALLVVALILVGGVCLLMTSDRYGLHADPTGLTREIPLDRSVYAVAKDRNKYRDMEILLHTEDKYMQHTFGQNSGGYLEFLLKMCRFYSGAHEFQKILVVSQKGLLISKKIQVAWDTGQMNNFAAEAHLNLGHYPEAIACATEAFRLMSALSEEGQPEALKSLSIIAESYYRAGNIAEARTAYSDFLRRWFAEDKRRTGLEASTTVPVEDAWELVTAGDFYSSLGDTERAVSLYETAQKIMRAHPESQTYNLGVANNQIATALAKEAEKLAAEGKKSEADRKLEQAEKDLEQAQAIIAQQRGKEDGAVAKVLFNLADVQWKRNEWMKALETRGQAREIWKTASLTSALMSGSK